MAKRMLSGLFTSVLVDETFLTVSWEMKIVITHKLNSPTKLRCQLMTSRFRKLLVFVIGGSCLGYTITKDMTSDLLTILLLSVTFPMVPWMTQMEIIYISYAHRKLMYQLTTFGFKTLFEFHPLGPSLGYTISKGIMQALLTIVDLYEFFPMVYITTQTNFISKSYPPPKLMYQHTTLGFTKMLAFLLLWSCLGYTIDEVIL